MYSFSLNPKHWRTCIMLVHLLLMKLQVFCNEISMVHQLFQYRRKFNCFRDTLLSWGTDGDIPYPNHRVFFHSVVLEKDTASETEFSSVPYDTRPVSACPWYGDRCLKWGHISTLIDNLWTVRCLKKIAVLWNVMPYILVVHWCFFRTLVNFYPLIWHYVSEDSTVHKYCFENLSYRIVRGLFCIDAADWLRRLQLKCIPTMWSMLRNARLSLWDSPVK